ncbi:hypothetical protein [Micromonospora sp. AB353]|uniref:hypothetical protein n=1 Tax=Micromonospora sp. AB353 TaxID=3413282 RepID=UPI003C2467EA
MSVTPDRFSPIGGRRHVARHRHRPAAHSGRSGPSAWEKTDVLDAGRRLSGAAAPIEGDVSPGT